MATILRWVLRLAGAALLGWMAGIHFYLYRNGYSEIPKIGNLFLVNGFAGAALCLAVVFAPRRWLWLAALAGAGLELGTLLGLLRTIHGGMFGFTESGQAPFVHETYVVEGLGTVVLGVLALTALNQIRGSHVTER